MAQSTAQTILGFLGKSAFNKADKFATWLGAELDALSGAGTLTRKATSLTTAGNGTITAAQLIGGAVTRSGPTAAFTDTTDTAANIIAALSPLAVNTAWEAMIVNTTAFAQTLAGGTGVTISGLAGPIPGGATAIALATYTGVGAVTLQILAIVYDAAGGGLPNTTLTGLLYESAAAGITAGTTRTQAGATPLVKEVNRVDVSTAPAAGSTLGDGVVLMAAAPGLDVTVINNTANIIQVYANGADTINGIAGAAGVPIPPNSVEIFEAAAAGGWNYDAGVGFSGALNTVLSVDNVSAAGANQAAATQLVADFNRVTTATANQGVKLPASAPGLDIIILNHSGVPITVYGSGTDTIDDIASATGVTQMTNSVVLFTCYAPGKWYTNGLATGYAGNGLETIQFADGVSAVGTTQGTATPLTAAINTVSTVAAGAGVNLPSSSPGLQVVVINTGANPLLVYPAQGANDTINGVAAAIGVALFPGTAASFNCTAAGAWTTQPATTKNAAFNANAATASTTLTAANISGGAATVDLALTGTLAGAANAQLPTVAAMVAALHSPTVGTSFRLRVINQSSANFAWTVTANTGWTMTGTMSIAQNSWREFVVTLNSLTAATLQSVATGSFS